MAQSWAEVDTGVRELDLIELDDIDLVTGARDGDDRCIEVILTRYRNYARSKARSYFLSGSDKEDVVQEGMIGLFKSIRDFDVSQRIPFKAFAELCISRQILTAIKTANRNKHRPLNSSVSLDAPFYGDNDSSGTVGDTLMSPSRVTDPAELILSAEAIEALRESMTESLTQLEGDVLRLYMDGKSYEEIAGVLGNHVKSIDNALQRIKRKLVCHLAGRNQDA